ncbi:MAG TPA: nuclear transport factor 2 family protein [Thermoanaerobaculia bacterium]|nr:nuclear transport factor 2 family protein [Thermoanaerobaculia bacterium]
MKTAIPALLSLMLAFAAGPASAGLQEDLLAMDKAQWTAWGKKDGATAGKYITEDHVQVIAGIGAVAGRDAVVKATNGLTCELKSFDFSGAKLRQVAPGVAILSYTATQDTTCDGTKLPPKLQVTSVYVQKDGKWLSANYQETPVE